MGRRSVVALMVGATALTSATVMTVSASAGQPAPAPLPNEGSAVHGLIVGYKTQAQEARSDHAASADIADKGRARGLDLDFGRRLGTGGVLVDLPGLDRDHLNRAMEAFRADPDVAYVEPDVRMFATAEPNDTDYAKQWHYHEAKAGMNVPGAWSAATGSGVTVAVVDTGYVAHSDLAANIVDGYDFLTDASSARDNNGRDANPADEGDWGAANECGYNEAAHNSSWHGTHVAGTIAASTGNGKGVAGVAHGAKIQPVRVLGKCGGTLSDIADGIVWAAGGTVDGVPANKTPAKVINMSLGGGGACSSTYQNAINTAVRRGSTVVVAAGNSNQNAADFQPANCSNVITVAATDRDGNRSSFRSDGTTGSNYGDVVDVAAPGGETWTATDRSNGILSTLNSGTTTPGSESYAFYQGTSMAAPHVAGLAALVMSKKTDLTPAQVEKLIKDNARSLPGTCSGGCGAGLADAAKAVEALGGGTDPVGSVSVTNPGDQRTAVGTAVDLPVKATGSTSGATLTYAATGLPAGLAISSSTGRIAGKPTTAGTSNVKITVTDNSDKSGTANFTWTVTSGDNGTSTVSVTNPGSQWSFKGWAAFPLQIKATDSKSLPVTFTATGLPAGLSISASGQITGTPTTAGTSSVTVTAKSSGGTGSTTFTWQIQGF